MGTKSLYLDDSLSIHEKAERIYGGLLESFLVAFKNSFDEQDIPEKFIVNIYADSILVALRTIDKEAADKLLHFLMTLQRDLISGTQTHGISIPSRAILARREYFSINIKESSDEILNRIFTSISICGGRGMVELDKSLNGLPVGVYISAAIKKDIKFNLYQEYLEVIGKDLYFVKQPEDAIEALLYIECRKQSRESGTFRGKKLKAIIKEGLEKGGIRNPFKRGKIREKWYPWIKAHEGCIQNIKMIMDN
jgi:hypothetical protein